MIDLVGVVDPTLSDLYFMIRKDRYPKKVNIFLRELSLGAINIAVCNAD